jgi:hypothetical protein
MARKTLLSEGEIRQFMKLANLSPIGTVRLSEMGYVPGNREEDALEDELGDMDSEADREGDEIGDLEGELDMADDELAVDGEMGMDDVDVGPEASAEDLVLDLLNLVQDWAQSHDVDMAVDTEAEETVGVEDDVAMGDDEVDVEMDAVEMGPEAGDEEEVSLDAEMALEEGDIVNEVARRVVARLQAQADTDKLTEELAERIMNRLASVAK